MLFAITAEDKPDSATIRRDTRPAHLEYLKTAGSRIVAAGPLLAPDGEAMIGSLLIVEAEGLAQAKAFAASDPYAKAGLFARTAIAPWRKVILNPPAE